MKKNKFSWGTGITIVIILFLVITIGAVILIHKVVDYDLVEEEYYGAEIEYQTQIERIKRTNALSEPLEIQLTKEFINLKFPSFFQSEDIKGIIKFYKPSDDLLDKQQAVSLDSTNQMYFATSELATGLWKIKVNWSVDEVEYYNEKLLMVP